MIALKRLFLAVFILSSASISAGSVAGELSFAAVANASRDSGRPIMMVFGAEECGYCERLKQDVLTPMARTGALDEQVLLREMDIHRGGKIKDFEGNRVRSRVFVRRYQVYATPTVVLLDAKGNELTRPIVGYSDAADYSARLEKAIGEAARALHGQSPS